MSKEAIQAVIDELEALPDADQQEVLGFLAELRRRHRVVKAGGPVPETRPALAVKDGLLVFTGQLDVPDTDWVQLARDEHDEELMQGALGATARR